MHTASAYIQPTKSKCITKIIKIYRHKQMTKFCLDLVTDKRIRFINMWHIWKNYSHEPDGEWIRTELDLRSTRLYGSQMCSLSTNIIPSESLTPSPAKVALLANAVHAVSLMYSLSFRDKHMHNPAPHNSPTLNRSQADWSDHPSWRSNSATCKMSRLQTLYSY